MANRKGKQVATTKCLLLSAGGISFLLCFEYWYAVVHFLVYIHLCFSSLYCRVTSLPFTSLHFTSLHCFPVGSRRADILSRSSILGNLHIWCAPCHNTMPIMPTTATLAGAGAGVGAGAGAGAGVGAGAGADLEAGGGGAGVGGVFAAAARAVARRDRRRRCWVCIRHYTNWAMALVGLLCVILVMTRTTCHCRNCLVTYLSYTARVLSKCKLTHPPFLSHI
jgi:hypothetical protein